MKQPNTGSGTASDGSYVKAISKQLPPGETLTNVTINGLNSGTHPPFLVQVELVMGDVILNLIDRGVLVSRGGGKTFHASWHGEQPIHPDVKSFLDVWTGNFTGADIDLSVHYGFGKK